MKIEKSYRAQCCDMVKIQTLFYALFCHLNWHTNLHTIWKVATYANMVKLDSFFWLQKIISDKNFPVRDCSVVNQSNKVLTFAFVTWIVEANWNDNKLSFTYLTKYQSHLFVWLLFLHTTVANILEKSVICLVTPGVKN